MNHPLQRALVPTLSILLAILLNAAIISATGTDPLMVAERIVRSTLGSPYGTGQVLFKATTLLFSALAVAIPFHLRLFNIGAEGQLQVGAIAAAISAASLPPSLTPWAAIPLAVLAAMTAGAGWASIAAILKIRFRVNEVISTIMLNFIAQGVSGYLLFNHFALPSTAHSAPIAENARIASFSELYGWFPSSPANPSLYAAIALSLGFWALLYRTRHGFEMRASGLQPLAAKRAGINPARHTLLAMAMGGASAGLGAANLVLGYKGYYEAGMTAGAGFSGIATALLAAAHPLWIMGSALFMGLLDYGGLAVNSLVPKEIFQVMTAVTILLVISATALNRRNS
ncbi:ABC transporter permease [Chlorobium phaeovibrioides]|uniref:ABC transporter permease n=2 Tax=Chlorobium phaeovibrioides TaxID=1094 RepID=A0A3S0NBT7_CHLPH|nr:ABC transporter permease [Chlorobium phaeovibrioides]HCD36426.1 ABC transporter permease [Chlorobium sp.]KAA6232664.1 ABC transporter permease [Chlorobium phaeovibrioides]MWV53737.1 ABC transporter permease [Chlorobium phaeovibrioides]RTY37405.1 ABC transporter permease [Chlorobium phaeovibrioides]RTY39899.1 ABC transporter permease [Chlorobium phaeovibrioides]